LGPDPERTPMSSVTLYYNPRCSKSREALRLLQEKGVEPQLVDYLRNPPDIRQIDRILGLLGLEPRELMRRDETEYAAHHLDNSALTRDQLVQAMVDHPVLIQRPIALKNDRAVLARPPERVLEIL
jgi:arsenate reductase